jgi:hypothetical protein
MDNQQLEDCSHVWREGFNLPPTVKECGICRFRYDEITGRYYSPAMQDNSLIGDNQDSNVLE